MSTRTVIAALGLAILLGGIAWFIVGGGPSGPAPNSLGVGDLIVNVNPMDVDRVRVTQTSGRIDEATRAGASAPWLLTVKTPGGPTNPPAWQLMPVRMSGFIRALNSVATRAAVEEGAKIGDKPLVLEVFSKGQESPFTIRYGGRQLGGNILVEVARPDGTGGMAIISDESFSALTEPGMPGWREIVAIPDATQLAARITLARPDAKIELARTNARWRLVFPFGAAADQTLVQNTLAALEAVRIDDFLDARQPTPAEAGLATPVATVTLEANRPDGKVTRTLAIGAAVPGGRGTVYARIGDMQHIVAIRADALARIPEPAVAFVSPAATQVPTTDIFNLALQRLEAPAPELVYRKVQDRWAEVLPDEAGTGSGGEVLALDDVGASQIGELLQFLTTVRPARIEPAQPEGCAMLASLTVGGLGGSPLDQVTIGVLPEADSISVVLAGPAGSVEGAAGGSGGGGGVHRIYEEGRTPLLVRQFLSGEGMTPLEKATAEAAPEK